VQNALKDRLKETFPSLAFEVTTPVGLVDCVTDDAIYEIAKLNSWKHALGQLCAYKLHLTRRKTVLYLYSPMEDPRAIRALAVDSTFHSVTESRTHGMGMPSAGSIQSIRLSKM
jgi:hypothetical protein